MPRVRHPLLPCGPALSPVLSRSLLLTARLPAGDHASCAPVLSFAGQRASLLAGRELPASCCSSQPLLGAPFAPPLGAPYRHGAGEARRLSRRRGGRGTALQHGGLGVAVRWSGGWGTAPQPPAAWRPWSSDAAPLCPCCWQI